LIILPILDIYRRYYGWQTAGFLLASFYAMMVVAGLAVEFVFQPSPKVKDLQAGPRFRTPRDRLVPPRGSRPSPVRDLDASRDA
jgi:hypothetical protein